MIAAEEARLRELQLILAELPSFVKPATLPPATEPLNLSHFDCWSPTKTGDPATDYEWGERHFATALAYSRRDDSALFIFYIMMTMRLHPIGTMERGFIDAAARCAIAGVVPPKAPEEWVGVVAHTPQAAERCRANETAMESAIILSRKEIPFRALAAYVLVDFLTNDNGPIDLGVWLFASAALNGSRS
jgi:hypothetical protein